MRRDQITFSILCLTLYKITYQKGIASKDYGQEIEGNLFLANEHIVGYWETKGQWKGKYDSYKLKEEYIYLALNYGLRT